MTKDLEETVRELGPAYRGVVARLEAAYRPESPVYAERPPAAGGRVAGWTIGYLLAASLLVFVGFGVFFRPGAPVSEKTYAVRCVSEAKLPYTLAYAPTAETCARLVETQRADGSWANDFQTRQNAAALRDSRDASAIVAYKRALRYLRLKGLRPLSAEELKARGDRAARDA